MNDMAVKVLRATSHTHPDKWAAKRHRPGAARPYHWTIEMEQADLQPYGWYRTRTERVYFETVCANNVAYCDLVKWTGKLPAPPNIHIVSYEKNGRCRLRPVTGYQWDMLIPCDPDTLVEYFPTTDILRVHYPPALRPFQNEFIKHPTAVTMFMKLERRKYKK